MKVVLAVEPLTFDRAVQLAREVVAEYGAEHVYEKHDPMASPDSGCFYVVNGAPSCLVAHVLVRHGVDVDELAGYEGQDGGLVAGDVAAATGKARQFLLAAQNEQDEGTPWGEAVEIGVRAGSRP